MGAEQLLHLFDRAAESGDIRFDERRQCLHQHEAADVRRVRAAKGRQAREGCGFVVAMHAGAPGIEHEHDPPRIGKRYAADERRRRFCPPAPAVNDDAAGIEQAYAHAGPAAAPQAKRIAADIERHRVQTPNAGYHCQRELRAGTETGMTWNGFVDTHMVRCTETEIVLQTLDISRRALRFRTGHVGPRRGRYGDARAQTADGNTDAAELASGLAIQVEEPEMQSGRNRGGHAGRPSAQLLTPEAR